MVNRVMQTFAVAGVIAGGAMIAQVPAITPSAVASTLADEESYDELLLSNQKIVRGKILEETETKIVFELHTNFGKIKTEYAKSDVLEVRRNAGKMEAVADDSTPDVTIVNEDDNEGDDEYAKKIKDPDAYKIYGINFTGIFGIHLSDTPLKELIADINDVFDDAVPNPDPNGVPTIVDPSVRDKHVVLIRIQMEPTRQGFQDIFRAEELVPYLETEIHERGRRIIFLIDQAVNGSAFMPWISPEMYFLPDGRMYFTSNFAEFDSGDDVVDEKLIGAFIGAAEGFAIRGGYAEIGPPIIKAMARSTYWFTVKWTGSVPDIMLREPNPTELSEGWEVLSDNGIGPNEDDERKQLRDPNDQLRLLADTAFRMGASKGTVQDYDDLLFQLGMNRNHVEMRTNAARILGDWNAQLDRFFTRAMRQNPFTGRPGELWVEFGDVSSQGANSFNDRRKIRGQQMRILRQIRSLWQRVEEAIPGATNEIANLELMIEQIKTQQQLDSQNR